MYVTYVVLYTESGKVGGKYTKLITIIKVHLT